MVPYKELTGKNTKFSTDSL